MADATGETHPNTERWRQWKARRDGERPPAPRCPACGRLVRTERPGGLCNVCWASTPEGKAEKRQRTRERVQASRARKQRSNQSTTETP